MSQRILGVLLLIRWLTPLMVAAVVVAVAYLVYSDAAKVSSVAIRDAKADIALIKDGFEETRSGLATVKADLVPLEAALAALPKLPALPTAITIPSISLSPISVQVPVPVVTETAARIPTGLSITTATPPPARVIPKFEISITYDTIEIPSGIGFNEKEVEVAIGPIKGLTIPLPKEFAELSAAMQTAIPAIGDLQQSVKDVAELEQPLATVRAAFSSLETDIEQVVEDVESVAGKDVDILMAAALLIAFLIAVAFIATTLDSLRHAIRLIRGLE